MKYKQLKLMLAIIVLCGVLIPECDAGLWSGKNIPYTLIVAADDAHPFLKQGAWKICDGTDDQVEIQAAMDKLADAGDTGIVHLIGKNFSISSAIAMRDRVSLEAMESNVGSTLTITAGSDCHGIELAFKEGKGNANIRGIYVNGDKSNNTGGSGFVMPYYGLRVTNSGAGVANSTVEVTSTKIIFKRDTVTDYEITLSDSPGTMTSEIISVVNGNDGWTVENSTGSTAGDPASTDTEHCTTTPSEALAVVGATDTYTVDADLVLGTTYDYFFIKCMTLQADDYGFYIPAGHSIHFDRCVAEYADVDGFYIVGITDGVRMYGCYGAFNIGNGYTINATHPILTACRSATNAGYGYSMPGGGVVLSGCTSQDNDESNKAGYYIGSSAINTILTGCRSIADEYGVILEGNYCTVSGCNIINADVYGIQVTATGNYNSITGNVILSSASYGIIVSGPSNTFSGNVAILNRGGAQQCIDTGGNNVWKGNSEECVFVERQGDLTLTVFGSNSTAIFQSAHVSNTVTFQLPAAVLGMTYSFAVGVDAKECRIEPNGSEIIRLGAETAGEYITANAINETINLTCVVPGEWEPYYVGGTWTDQP